VTPVTTSHAVLCAVLGQFGHGPLTCKLGLCWAERERSCGPEFEKWFSFFL
jgi:hypothetical protein